MCRVPYRENNERMGVGKKMDSVTKGYLEITAMPYRVAPPLPRRMYSQYLSLKELEYYTSPDILVAIFKTIEEKFRGIGIRENLLCYRIRVK